MEQIVVVGGGGHAKVIIAVLKKIGRYRIYGYTDVKNRGPILGVPYLGDDEKLASAFSDNDVKLAVVALWLTGDRKIENIVYMLKKTGFATPPIISPDSVINEEVAVGDGTVIMDGAVVNSGTHIGEYCIINTLASIDHDCRIGSFVHIAPGAVLSGGVEVGDHGLIGTGASIIQSRTITAGCSIGAGAVVVHDCNKPGTYLGNPARRHNG